MMSNLMHMMVYDVNFNACDGIWCQIQCIWWYMMSTLMHMIVYDVNFNIYDGNLNAYMMVCLCWGFTALSTAKVMSSQSVTH